MMAGGNDGTDSTPRVLVRRPTIRPRPVTPPRSANAATTATAPAPTPTWKLPPVRLPSPRPLFAEARADVRPVLLLVADASDQFDIARRHARPSAVTSAPRHRFPRTVAMVAAGALVMLAVAAALAVAGRPEAVAQATPASPASPATPATPATEPLPAVTTAAPTSPLIPLVDVKSLPPAR
jgi:ribonuclease E